MVYRSVVLLYMTSVQFTPHIMLYEFGIGTILDFNESSVHVLEYCNNVKLQ